MIFTFSGRQFLSEFKLYAINLEVQECVLSTTIFYAALMNSVLSEKSHIKFWELKYCTTHKGAL